MNRHPSQHKIMNRSNLPRQQHLKRTSQPQGRNKRRSLTRINARLLRSLHQRPNTSIMRHRRRHPSPGAQVRIPLGRLRHPRRLQRPFRHMMLTLSKRRRLPHNSRHIRNRRPRTQQTISRRRLSKLTGTLARKVNTQLLRVNARHTNRTSLPNGRQSRFSLNPNRVSNYKNHWRPKRIQTQLSSLHRQRILNRSIMSPQHTTTVVRTRNHKNVTLQIRISRRSPPPHNRRNNHRISHTNHLTCTALLVSSNRSTNRHNTANPIAVNRPEPLRPINKNTISHRATNTTTSHRNSTTNRPEPLNHSYPLIAATLQKLRSTPPTSTNPQHQSRVQSHPQQRQRPAKKPHPPIHSQHRPP